MRTHPQLLEISYPRREREISHPTFERRDYHEPFIWPRPNIPRDRHESKTKAKEKYTQEVLTSFPVWLVHMSKQPTCLQTSDTRHAARCASKEKIKKKQQPTGQKKNSRMGQGSWVSEISRLNSCRSRTSVEPLLSQPEWVRKHDWTNQRPLRR